MRRRESIGTSCAFCLVALLTAGLVAVAAPPNPYDLLSTPPIMLDLCPDGCNVQVGVTVTDLGGLDTYAYTVTNATCYGGLRRFVVPGQGTFVTAGTTQPAGWTQSRVVDTVHGVATWWIWEAEAGSELPPGDSAVFSLAVQGAASNVRVALGFSVFGLCEATSSYDPSVVGPSACQAPDPAETSVNCSCAGGTCAPGLPCAGSGQRLDLRSAHDKVVHVPACQATWMRHGLGHLFTSGEDPSQYFVDHPELTFELYIDDVLTPATSVQTFVSGPAPVPGTLIAQRFWCFQFPAGYFTAGTAHTVRGVWQSMAAPQELVLFEQSLTVVADPCLPPDAALPDLMLTIDDIDYSCEWNGSQWDCTIGVRTTVRNVGAAPAGLSRVEVTSAVDSQSARVEGLEPGASTSLTLRLRFTCDRGQCPSTIALRATADCRFEVTESAESNNTATGQASS